MSNNDIFFKLFISSIKNLQQMQTKLSKIKFFHYLFLHDCLSDDLYPQHECPEVQNDVDLNVAT